MFDSHRQTTGVFTIVEALIDALRLRDEPLHRACSDALVVIGHRAVPRLQEVAADPQASLLQRDRVLVVMQRIQASGELGADAGKLILRALLHCLRVSNQRLNQKASQALVQTGPGVTDYLLHEAVRHRDQPGYCVRLLQAAAAAGGTATVSHRLDLFFLAGDKHERVRNAAAQLLLQLRTR